MPLRLSDPLPYGHLCSVYELQTQAAADAELFLSGGLGRNEKCVHIADASQWPRLRDRHDAGGLEINKALAVGQMVLVSLPELFLKRDPSDLYRVFVYLKKTARDAQRAGFQGVRVAIDMSWLPQANATLEQLREYEQLLTDLAESMQCIWFCQHPARSAAANELLETVLLHPAVVHRGVVCPNIHCKTEEAASCALTLEQLLETLYREYMLQLRQSVDLQRLEAAISSQGEFAQVVRFSRSDGAAHRLQFVAQPASRKKSDVLEFIGCLVDVATYTTADEALLVARGELERILRVMNIGELAVAIAHEMRQPLMSITTEAYTAIRLLAQQEPDLDEVRASLQHIVQSGHRAGAVITSIQSLVRQEARVEKQFDMNKAIVAAVELLDRTLQDNRVHLHLEVDLTMPPVYGHRVQFEQVMLNLITNAMEAIVARGGAERDILVRSWVEDARQIHVTVRDSGVGLDEALAKKIFQPFVTTKPRGMGLGLSISRAVIDSHNGRLWAMRNEEPSHGTTFHLTLPLGVPPAE